MKKSDMLIELLTFMETQDHTSREEWYVSDREMTAKIIERFSTEHLGMPLTLDSVPLKKVEPHATEMLKGKS